MLDGTHRGDVGIVLAAGGGLVWLRIAGVPELLTLPAASVAAPRSAAARLARRPQL